jgi:hypothetical protein
MNVLGVDTALLVFGIVCVVGAILLVLLIVAPWKGVVSEPPLDEDVETRLLLGEDPEQIAADEDAEDAMRAEVRDLDDNRDTTGDLKSLANLDDRDDAADDERRSAGGDAG